MKVYDVRSLINGNLKKITVGKEMKLCFDAFKEIVEKNNAGNLSELDIFYAGYIFANPIIREQLLKNKKEDIIIENRINYSRR